MLANLISQSHSKLVNAMTSSGNDVFVGAIDQGTTSTRFLIFNTDGEVVALHQIEFKQIYPQPGYVSTPP